MPEWTESASAVVSACGVYRYRLERSWGDGPRLVWVMLNPSTADAHRDGPTIRRVRSFTRREGYDGFVVVNLWALRATDPKDLHARRSAFEEENLAHVAREVKDRDVIAAWGANVCGCPCLQRVRTMLLSARSLRCLGMTKSGQPRHPLMVRGDHALECVRTREAKEATHARVD